MSNLEFEPAFAAHAAINPPPTVPDPKTVFDYRANMNQIISFFFRDWSVPDGMIETTHAVKARDGADVPLFRFQMPAQAEGGKGGAAAVPPQPALIHFHGGGVVACPADTVCKPNFRRTAAESGIQIFAPEYRLAPEHPAPTPVEDCYRCVEWIIDNAAALNVDPARIIVMGESGGGTLAAGVSLLARDRGLSPPLAGQVLIYPMLDDRSTGRLNPESPWYAMLKMPWATNIDLAWGGYVGEDKRGKPEADVSPYAAPARAETLKGLPPTYIDCGSLDLFRDESMEFAMRCAKDEVAYELHIYPGLPHGFDMIAPDIPITKNAKDNRYRFMRNTFGLEG
ncbi:hypothetical protein N3K66_007527 [Trichothecium roseum]|uniref:Uncharacterized protein n=1 Tax=Trichothecium roseum TaxID=47278 RepID=A0ACC0UU88_9HYPO|nr:hypothetical protein N3K66_007527 [Trichothecium roseum]